MGDVTKDQTDDKARGEAGIATEKENAKLEHSQGGVTTRDDTHDLGVPMLQGDASEPQGPEDALGEGPKRGDYAERILTQPHEGVALPDGGAPITGKTEYTDSTGKKHTVDGSVLDVAPQSTVVPQGPRVADVGEVKGEKGGVTTA